MLYRRQLALMFAVWCVALVFELTAGHVAAFYGRPLFERAIGYAALFGLGDGARFALVTVLGRSSLGTLALGLLSGFVVGAHAGFGRRLEISD